jgi:two-component system response regulator YesN
MYPQDPLKILVVDDEPVIRDMISNVITWNRPLIYVSRICANGQEALQHLRSGALVDLVITDIKMPIMDGITLIKILKQEYPSVKFLLITAFAEFSYAQTALGVGALDYLVKPIKQQELLSVLDRLTYGIPHSPNTIEETDFSSRLLSLLIKYINENIATATIVEAADCLGYSANHLSKLLQERFGHTFSELLHTAKMEHASKLLDTGASVNQVITKIGYVSERRFRQAYATYLHLTQKGLLHETT